MTAPESKPQHTVGMLLFFVSVLAFALYWFGYLLWDFVTDMVLGFLVAGGCRSYYLRLLPHVRGRKHVAATLITVVVAVLIALPTLWLVTSLSRQAATAYSTLSEALAKDSVQEVLRGEGWLGRHASQFADLFGFSYTPEAFREAATSAARELAAFLTGQLNALLTNVLSALYHFTLMLVVVYFGLIDGPEIKRRIFDLSPLPDDEEERIVRTFSNVGSAILLGNGIGSALQGVLGGLAMWTAGLPSPLFWGVVMTIFAFLPLLGIQFVSVPASLYLLLTGRVSAALGLFLFCLVQSLFIENVLKAQLMGSRMHMHSMLIFFAVLGGISSFGLMGLLYGPLIAAFLLTILDLYERSYRDRLFVPEGGALVSLRRSRPPRPVHEPAPVPEAEEQAAPQS